jgi:hypothetical protein
MTPVLFFRSRGLASLTAATVIVCLASHFVSVDLSQNPVDPTGFTLLSDLVGLAGGAMWSLLLRNPMPELERLTPPLRRMSLRALWLFVAVILLAGLGGLVFALRGPTLAWVHVRNTLFGMGLGTMSGVLLPQLTAWILPTLVVAAVWLGGLNNFTAEPAAWAIPCFPWDSSVSWFVSVGAFVVPGLAYTLVDDAR